MKVMARKECGIFPQKGSLANALCMNKDSPNKAVGFAAGITD